MSRAIINESSLTAIGNAIRTKTGGTDKLSVPTGMVDAINGIQTDGGTLKIQRLTFSDYGDCFDISRNRPISTAAITARYSASSPEDTPMARTKGPIVPKITIDRIKPTLGSCFLFIVGRGILRSDRSAQFRTAGNKEGSAQER